MKTQRICRVTAQLFRRRAFNATPAPAALLWEGDSEPILKEAGWAPETVWSGAKNLLFELQTIIFCSKSSSFSGIDPVSPAVVLFTASESTLLNASVKILEKG
jgi:hypothetical protein